MITLTTTHGDITIQLYPEEAPNIVENFRELVAQKKYDGVNFHRVIKGFMIQTGDYENGNGTGGQAAKGGTLPDEISSKLKHQRGAVSMANRGPNTNGSQFFIVHQDAPHLDGGYSIFGQVTEGMEVVDKIAGVPVNRFEGDSPIDPVTIVKARVQKES